MVDGNQVQLVMSYLNGYKLYGKLICIMFLKYQNVQLFCEGQEDQGLIKDYGNLFLYCFKKLGFKNFQNIFLFLVILYFFNILFLVFEEDFKVLFFSNGGVVKGFKFFQKDCKMVLIQMGFVEEVVQVFIDLYNYDFGENYYLWVFFFKFIIQGYRFLWLGFLVIIFIILEKSYFKNS